MSTPIILAHKLLAEVQRIGAVLGLSDNDCVGYLLEAYLDSFPGVDTRCHLQLNRSAAQDGSPRAAQLNAKKFCS